MEIVIRARPEFSLTLSDAELAILSHLSALHYDATCKSASQEGGFIWRWARIHKLSKEFTDDPEGSEVEDFKELTASFHDLNICLKIMEISTYNRDHQIVKPITANDQETVLVKNLRIHFLAVLQKANDLYGEWKFVYKSP